MGEEGWEEVEGKKVYRAGGRVCPPRLLYRREPHYPELARQARGQGIIEMVMVINEKGQVENIQIVKPLGLGLDESAIEAVSQWKFEPGRRNGEPVAVRASIQVQFRLL